MKREMTLAVLAASMIFMSGCDSVDKAEAHVLKIEKGLAAIEKKLSVMEQQQKSTGAQKGITCDNASALETLKSLMDKNSDGEYEVDKANIVVWDYNPVGRYTCRAKVKKIGEKNPLGKEISSMMSGMIYGLSDGGWVHYHTYITTKDEDNFYVGLDTLKN